MYQKLLFISFSFLFAACSQLKSSSGMDSYQNQALTLLRDKRPIFLECAKKYQLNQNLKEKRIRSELFIELNHRGELEQFNTDDRPYPTNFVNCIFTAIESIKFPAMEDEDAHIHIRQPIIFKVDSL